MSRHSITNEGRVYAFLKANPLSTSEEIFKATGSGVIGMKYVRGKRYNGQWVWRLNHPKMKRDGIEI